MIKQTKRYLISISSLSESRTKVAGKDRTRRPALILLFAKKFFRTVRTRGGTNEVDRTNILAPGFQRRLTAALTFFPPSPPKKLGNWPWEVVSSYSSATAPGFHGISCADPLLKTYLSPAKLFPVPPSNAAFSFLITGGAGFIGSNLVLALQDLLPEGKLTVIDDFRSGDFKNLAGYHGDVVAQDLATMDWHAQ